MKEEAWYTRLNTKHERNILAYTAALSIYEHNDLSIWEEGERVSGVACKVQSSNAEIVRSTELSKRCSNKGIQQFWVLFITSIIIGITIITKDTYLH